MRSSRGTIMEQALQRVGNTSKTMFDQARIRLNRILHDLHQGWDWPFLWTTITLPLAADGTVTLPADFVKAEDDQSLVVLSANGQPMRRVVQEVDHRTFAALTQSGDVAGTIPRIWTIDYATMTGRAWPRNAASVELRYKFLPPDMPTTDTIAYDADIPSFPWDTFLMDALAEWGMAYEDDPRRAEQLTINEAMLQRLRGATWPERSFPSTVPLDPVFFSTPTWGSGRGGL